MPLDSSSLWESLPSTVYYRTWDVPCKPEQFFFPLFPSSPRIHRSYTLGTNTGSSLSCGTSAGRQPFPSSPALSSLSTNPFSFLGVQSSESRGLSGREAAVGCLQGGRKGVWGSQDVGGKCCFGEPFEGEGELSYFRDVGRGIRDTLWGLIPLLWHW